MGFAGLLGTIISVVIRMELAGPGSQILQCKLTII